MIEAMHVTYQDDSKAVEAQSDLFASMADAIDECSRIVKDARLQMDAIDREAHEAIQRIIDDKGGWFGPLAMLSLIWSILTQSKGCGRSGECRSRCEHCIAGNASPSSNGAHAWRKCESAGASRSLSSRWIRAFFMADQEIPKQIPGQPPQAPIRDDANAPPEKVTPDKSPVPNLNGPIRDDDSVKVPPRPKDAAAGQLPGGKLPVRMDANDFPDANPRKVYPADPSGASGRTAPIGSPGGHAADQPRLRIVGHKRNRRCGRRRCRPCQALRACPRPPPRQPVCRRPPLRPTICRRASPKVFRPAPPTRCRPPFQPRRRPRRRPQPPPTSPPHPLRPPRRRPPQPAPPSPATRRHPPRQRHKARPGR